MKMQQMKEEKKAATRQQLAEFGEDPSRGPQGEQEGPVSQLMTYFDIKSLEAIEGSNLNPIQDMNPSMINIMTKDPRDEQSAFLIRPPPSSRHFLRMDVDTIRLDGDKQ